MDGPRGTSRLSNPGDLALHPGTGELLVTDGPADLLLKVHLGTGSLVEVQPPGGAPETKDAPGWTRDTLPRALAGQPGRGYWTVTPSRTLLRVDIKPEGPCAPQTGGGW